VAKKVVDVHRRWFKL